ncbi:MAG: undecaprenyldiphospho-muramoylpentapeptide beta-N-acetylglucosaminyltransferase [Acidobacteria bacterium]|nr:undecaprenyldiphospho-muramoylpentapeptide beta-N-acetylglucosaminyltransferase [Acidobacteriota bacterium]MCB9396573.1 undecaprenyldiphospho-muramoylpentapeptide beta-N-acetylglucosaminyltransferase [Acidobacteriota bacterium]
MNTYIIAGGGTGGHIFPALALGEAVRRKDPNARVLFAGTRYGLEVQIMAERGETLLTLPMRGLLGKSIWQKAALLWRLPASLAKAFVLLLKYRPKAVLGVGGYASIPLALAASFLRIPVVLQEQNAVAGLANRLVSRFARLACLGFPEAAMQLRCPALVTGNPIRRQFYELPNWSTERRQILILGGSQGARSLNQHLPALLAQVKEIEKYTIVHQAGAQHVSSVEQAYQTVSLSAQVVPFIQDMGAAFAKSLLILGRAGASTVSEICAARIPAVLIPFPQATHDHQTANARSLAHFGAAQLVKERELDGLVACLNEVLMPDTLRAMHNAFPDQAQPASDWCVDLTNSLVAGRSVSQLLKENPVHVSQN